VAIILKGGLLIDGSGREPIPDATIVLDKGVIARVETARKVVPQSDDTVIDAQGRTLMPGLIDAHTHLGYHSRQPDVWTQELKESVELNTLYAAANARAILHCGFTAIGDGGCRGFLSSAVRDAVALVRGPHARQPRHDGDRYR
jgi:imidazolonepropionase-like amidohydrolase